MTSLSRNRVRIDNTISRTIQNYRHKFNPKIITDQILLNYLSNNILLSYESLPLLKKTAS